MIKRIKKLLKISIVIPLQFKYYRKSINYYDGCIFLSICTIEKIILIRKLEKFICNKMIVIKDSTRVCFFVIIIIIATCLNMQ